MRVEIKERAMSTSSGLKRRGDIVEMTAEEVEKIQKLRPHAIEVLAEEATPTFKRSAPAKKKPTRKRARNANGTLKADDPSTPDVNEAWEDG